METCTFCKIGQTVGKKMSTEHFWWKLDIHPVSPGHTLIVPKQHIRTLSELTIIEWMDLGSALEKAVDYIKQCDRKTLDTEYAFMRDSRITPNSVRFAKKMLASRWLGREPHGYNHGVNQGAAAGQTVDHLHWHVIPRYEGDMPDPSGGVRYVIPEMGNYTAPR